jgi:chemotaxis protein histidine kinase CheA
MTWEPCVTCARLRKCNEVDHNLLLEGGGCSLHEVVHEGVVCARLRIMDEFGAQAIPTKSNLKKGVIVMAGKVSKTAANKRTLRALGKALGVIPRGGASFKLSAEEICQMIMDTGDERFANLDQMSDDEVSSIDVDSTSAPAPKKEEPAEESAEETAGEEAAEEVEEEKPAPKKRTRRARKPKVEEPVEEESDDSDEDTSDEDSAPSKRKPAARRGRRPSRKAPAKSESAGSVDLSKLEEMVKVIGEAGDDRDKKIKALGKMLEALVEKIDAIDGFLTYEYNQDAEGNEIGSLTEVDWT